MDYSLETSNLMKYRLSEGMAEKNIARVKQSLQDFDFPALASVIMQECRTLHAICLETDPPLFYMNDISRAIISEVVKINKDGPPKVAYSLDAGCHVFLFSLEENYSLVKEIASRFMS